MSTFVEDLKMALSGDHNLMIMDELTEEQALNIANDLHKLGRKPTDVEAREIIEKYYDGQISSAMFESRDQMRTNQLQQTVLKMIQNQKNKE
ncbi:TPA: hypothetical protein RGO87_003636 [Proteus mirabilis]|nr:hypothetical protein [Proteus mirabilis]